MEQLPTVKPSQTSIAVNTHAQSKMSSLRDRDPFTYDSDDDKNKGE